MSDLKQVHDTMKKIYESGVPIDGVEFWDHGGQNMQEMGDIGWSPTDILLNPQLGVGKFIQPGGTVGFRGCNVLPPDPCEHQKYQNLANQTGLAIEAGEDKTNYYLGGRAPRQRDRYAFSPGGAPSDPSGTPGNPTGKKRAK